MPNNIRGNRYVQVPTTQVFIRGLDNATAEVREACRILTEMYAGLSVPILNRTEKMADGTVIRVRSHWGQVYIDIKNEGGTTSSKCTAYVESGRQWRLWAGINAAETYLPGMIEFSEEVAEWAAGYHLKHYLGWMPGKQIKEGESNAVTCPKSSRTEDYPRNET